MPPKKKQKAAAPAEANKPPQQERTRPHRTPQTPFEHTDETLYTVEKITAVRWSGGARQWLVRWEGYGEQDDTWEPIEHLVGCATFIREFESRREEEDKQEKARALERRQQAKEAAAAEAAARREQAAATALSGTGNDGASDGIAPETVSGNVLKEHKSKRGTVWQVFDLSVEHPTCTVLKPNGERCGVQPAKSAGTSNYWNHLWSHHREIWYELRMKDGTLNAAGVTELTTLKESFA